MRTVDYDHVLQILERCAKQNMTAREAYQSLIFAFGERGEK